MESEKFSRSPKIKNEIRSDSVGHFGLKKLFGLVIRSDPVGSDRTRLDPIGSDRIPKNMKIYHFRSPKRVIRSPKKVIRTDLD